MTHITVAIRYERNALDFICLVIYNLSLSYPNHVVEETQLE